MRWFSFLIIVDTQCIGPVDERKEEEEDRNYFLFSNLQTSQQLLVIHNWDKGFFRLTLTNISGNIVMIILLLPMSSRQKPEDQPHKAVMIDG